MLVCSSSMSSSRADIDIRDARRFAGVDRSPFEGDLSVVDDSSSCSAKRSAGDAPPSMSNDLRRPPAGTFRPALLVLSIKVSLVRRSFCTFSAASVESGCGVLGRMYFNAAGALPSGVPSLGVAAELAPQPMNRFGLLCRVELELGAPVEHL